MTLTAYMFKKGATKGDRERDKNLTPPEDVEAIYDINYLGNDDKYNLLDIYYPKGTKEKLPTVVSIHGGGYVYGTKEVYKYYGMFWASLGFTFVNFNYHLAPKAKFPSQLKETNQVLQWCVKNADQYHIDLDNVFMVGDSAGAQLNSHYAVIYSNKEYQKLFDFTVPSEVKIRAVGLNCGMYEINTEDNNKMTKDLMKDYLGKNPERFGDMLKPMKYLNGDFPPAFVMTSYYDFLRANAEPMHERLTKAQVEATVKCYGNEGQEYMAHVCHVNMNLEEAKEINREQAEFFRKHMV